MLLERNYEFSSVQILLLTVVLRGRLRNLLDCIDDFMDIRDMMEMMIMVMVIHHKMDRWDCICVDDYVTLRVCWWWRVRNEDYDNSDDERVEKEEEEEEK